MKAGDLLIDESELVESVVRSSIIVADLALSVAGGEPLSRV
jgi:hypothetical protein